MSKIAIYTIAKNEEQFVERWYQSAKDADYLFILDTGSTDNTVKIARELGINVATQVFNPWRFDHARNAALGYLPEDIDLCIALDMDEILVDGWKKELEKALSDGVNRPRYQYTWSWNKDGSPGLIYGGDKIHSRHGFIWKHPVHEVLSSENVESQGWYDLEIHHYPDSSKSRSQYMPLLKLAIEEDPEDDRNAFYYARELFFHSEMQEAAKEFKRHLSLPKAMWKPERAASMRYLSKIEDKESWLLRAVAECPDRREALVELSQHYYEINQFELCYAYAIQALKIKEKPLEYLCEDFAWGYVPYDLAAISAYNIGIKDKAKEYGEKALSIDPKNDRLISNMSWYIKSN
jgi:glycosyltransferase involved in cell wall biosynthesis